MIERIQTIITMGAFALVALDIISHVVRAPEKPEFADGVLLLGLISFLVVLGFLEFLRKFKRKPT